MKRSRFSEEQIVGILKGHQAELSATGLCRKYGRHGRNVLQMAFEVWRHESVRSQKNWRR